MASNAYWANVLTGGGAGALDAIDGAALADLDTAFVVALAGNFVYSLDDDSAAAEMSPNVISPDANAGTKRWVLVNVVNQQFNNLLKNGSFEDSALPVANTPSGWTLEGTPTVAVETSNIAVGYGTRSAKITGTGAANEGLNQTITGLKASTKYSIRWYSMVTAGDTARLLTTGATTNADTDVTATSMTQSVATFVTDASGTDVVLKVVAKVATDIAYFDNIIVAEGNIAPSYVPHPNDQHLKAIDYQDSAPANLDYGLLRMECGITSKAAPAAVVDSVTVTFGTAFSKILCVEATVTNTNANDGVSRINVSGYSMATNSIILRYETIDGGNLNGDADPVMVSWIAIGI